MCHIIAIIPLLVVFDMLLSRHPIHFLFMIRVNELMIFSLFALTICMLLDVQETENEINSSLISATFINI